MNDKDEFINKKNLLQEFANEINKFDSVAGEFQRGIDWALRMIIKHPTTDVEKVRHGYWIMDWDDLWPEDSQIICSVCRGRQPTRINDNNYCPKCGAKMDKEKTI